MSQSLQSTMNYSNALRPSWRYEPCLREWERKNRFQLALRVPSIKPFESWIKGEGKVEPLALDKDVFEDGSVIVLRTPGHTPGHQALLVKLPQTGPVILSGDAIHFRGNYDAFGVPPINDDRAQTVASIERIKNIASNLKAIRPQSRARRRRNQERDWVTLPTPGSSQGLQ
jgi:glyoxylase-like metal-dependent hydrolase (beta-lactamase superfamily II)